MPVRVVFMGSPDFALPTLRKVADRYHLVGVVTQPDKPAGRGRLLTPPPVKRLASELGIDLIQPRRLREPEAMDRLLSWNPDLIIVAAFGQILRSDVLNLPPYGCINVHASLLPRWRGAAPIQAAILNGDTQTGVTIMRMDVGVDTGGILAQRTTNIDAAETTARLSPRLAEISSELLIEILPDYLNGKLQPQPQVDALATSAPMLKKEEGLLDFSQTAQSLARRVRAFNPWPGAYTFWQDQILKIHLAHAQEQDKVEFGKHYIDHGYPALGSAEGLLVLDEVQPAGKKAMSGPVFLNGARDWDSKS